MHVDPVRTHVISAIINIDQQLDDNVSLKNFINEFLFFLKLASIVWFFIIPSFLFNFYVFCFNNTIFIIYAFVFLF